MTRAEFVVLLDRMRDVQERAGGNEDGTCGFLDDVAAVLRDARAVVEQASNFGAPAATREYAGWLIKKRGLYYRPNFRGYTDNASDAGRYTLTQAKAEANIEPGNFHLIAAPECHPDGFRVDCIVRERGKPT